MDSKKWYLSKTLWISLAAICTGIGTYVTGEQNLQELMLAVMGAVFAILRLFTNSSVTK